MCERPQAYSHKLRKARKDHECCECSGIINKGENYHYHSGIWEFEPDSFKICVDCELLREEINSKIKYYHDKVAFKELFEVVQHSDYFDKYVSIRIKRNAKIYDWMKKYA